MTVCVPLVKTEGESHRLKDARAARRKKATRKR